MAQVGRPDEPQDPTTQPMTPRPPTEERTVEQTLRLSTEPATAKIAPVPEPPTLRIADHKGQTSQTGQASSEALTVAARVPPRRPRAARQPVSVGGFLVDPLIAVLALALAVLVGVLLTTLLVRTSSSSGAGNRDQAEQQGEQITAPGILQVPQTPPAEGVGSPGSVNGAGSGSPPVPAPDRDPAAAQPPDTSGRDKDAQKADKEREKRQDEMERERGKRDAEREREREKRDAEREREQQKRDRERD